MESASAVVAHGLQLSPRLRQAHAIEDLEELKEGIPSRLIRRKPQRLTLIAHLKQCPGGPKPVHLHVSLLTTRALHHGTING